MSPLSSPDAARPPERPPEEGPTDASLLRRLQRGNADAATLLYFRYAQQLLSLTADNLGRDLSPRLDAEDIVQSVFRTFFRRTALGQYEVPEGQDLWKLLLVIALNKVRNAGAHHRAACRDIRRTPATEPLPPEGTTQPDDTPLTLLTLTVEEALSQLPPLYRTIMEHRIEGHEIAEIAVRVKRSKRSVERALQEVRADLYARIHQGP